MPFFKKGIEIRAIIVLFYLFYGRLLSARLDQTKNREFDWVFRGALLHKLVYNFSYMLPPLLFLQYSD